MFLCTLKDKSHRITAFFFLFFIILVADYEIFAQTLQKIKNEGKITIAFTESSKNTVNYAIAKEFAKFLDVKFEEEIVSWNEIFANKGVTPSDYKTNPAVSYTPDALKKSDIIANTIYLMDWRKKFFDYSGILQINDLLIAPAHIADRIKTYPDMKGLTIALLENSSYEMAINRINKYIDGGITIIKTKSETESLQLLREEKVDALVAVSFLSLSYLKKNPQFKLVFPLNKPQNVGWAVKKNNKGIAKEISNFFRAIKKCGKLDKLFIDAYGIDYTSYLEVINAYSERKKEVNIRDLDEIRSSGKIRIAMTDRYLVHSSKGKKQFSRLLVEEFAKFLGVKPEFIVLPNFAQYFETKEGYINYDSAYTPEIFYDFDLSCDLFEPLDWRLKKIDILGFLPDAKVVIARKTTPITYVDDLYNLRAATVKGTSYETTLKKHQLTNYFYTNSNSFFDKVKSGAADYVLTNISGYRLQDYPELETKFIVGDIKKIGWAIKKNQPLLRQKIVEFYEYAWKKGLLARLFKKQTGMSLNMAESYLVALQETAQLGSYPLVFYGEKQGLPQQDVLSIFQDQTGYLWFATRLGVAKYNGRSMKIFDAKSGLAGNTIFDINQDTQGNLYFAGPKGISRLRKSTGKPEILAANIAIRKIYPARRNKMYFYGNKYTYLFEEGDSIICLNKTIQGMPLYINSVAQKRGSNKVYIAAESGLYCLQRKKIKKIGTGTFTSLLFDQEGNFWAASESKLYFSDQEINHLSESKSVEKTLNLDDFPINDIRQAKDGAIWCIADYKAVQILSLKQKAIVFDKQKGLLNHKITSFYVDNEENLWFGFSGGLQKLGYKNLRNLFPKQLNGHVNSIFKDRENQMWVSTNNGVYYLKGGLHKMQQLKSKLSNVMTFDASGNIVIANNEKIQIFDYQTLKKKKERKFKNRLAPLTQVRITPQGHIFLLTGNEGIVYYLENFTAPPVTIKNTSTGCLSHIREYRGKILGADNTGLVIFSDNSFQLLARSPVPVYTFYPDSLFDREAQKYTPFLWLGTQNGLAQYINGEIRFLDNKELNGLMVTAIEHDKDSKKMWIGTSRGIFLYNKETGKTELSINSGNGLKSNEISIDGLHLDKQNNLWIGTYHGASVFNSNKFEKETKMPVCRLESVTINGKKYTEIPPVLKADQNNLTFEISGLSFKDESAVEYEMYLQGLDNDPVIIRGRKNIATYPYLPYGTYSFKYRIKGKDGIWSYFKSIDFKISKPFYLKFWFIFLVFLFLIALSFLVQRWRMRVLRRINEKLEKTVAQRTLEITEKNEKLESQKDQIQTQRDIAEKQRDEILLQKKEIEDSILYAKRIQNAILPPRKVISRIIPDNFIFFKPRDIVSGDFYWVTEKEDIIYYAAADCTGHGVPGAFMSMLGISFLNDIISSAPKDIKPAEILNLLKEKVILSLHQTGEAREAKDGMDIALCKINPRTHLCEFAGAFSPLLLVRGQQILEYSADHMPVSIYNHRATHKSFTNNQIELEKGDSLYIFSDGYADQFGGSQNKKFMLRRLKQVFLKINDLSMQEQGEYIDQLMKKWMQDEPQVDDMLIIGVKY